MLLACSETDGSIVGDRRLNCGSGCVWQASLVLSFGVWCIRRVLDLSLVESRPELWGKYTYVLNRLQEILDLHFASLGYPSRGVHALREHARFPSPCPAPSPPRLSSWG